MNSKNVFENVLPTKLSANPALLAHLGLKSTVIRLEIPGAGDWCVNFDDGGNCSVSGSPTASVDSHIQMKDDVFAKLVSGKLNVPMALVTRKIKVSGDKMLAAKVGEALRSVL